MYTSFVRFVYVLIRFLGFDILSPGIDIQPFLFVFFYILHAFHSYFGHVIIVMLR